MIYLDTYTKELQKITRSYIESVVSDIVILNSGIIIRSVQQRWKRGEGVEGGKIGVYSWDEYRMFKQQMNPLAGGYVDLFLTGDLSEGLTVRKTGNNMFQVYSTDEKYNKIGQKYGFEEYGLTDEEAYQFFNELYAFAYETILLELWK